MKGAKKKNKKITAKKGTTKTKSKRYLKKDLDFFKKILLEEKEQLLRQIDDIYQETIMKSQKDISGDISGYSIHMADVASDHYARELNFTLVSNEQRLLIQINEALKRIEDKTYGICPGCEKLIPKTRLKAIPYASYCAKCQQTIDQQMPHFQ